MKREIKKDRQGKEYIAYKVPVVFDLKGYAIKVEIADGETVTVHAGVDDEKYSGAISFADRIENAIAQAVEDHFAVKPEHYVRCTNDRNEIEIAKAGKLRASRNYRDGFAERGVSVSYNYAYVAGGEYKYAYFVEGDVAAIGSNGEPLMKPETVRPIGRMMMRETMLKRYAARDEEKLDAMIYAQGWSRDAYNALTFPAARRFALEI